MIQHLLCRVALRRILLQHRADPADERRRRLHRVVVVIRGERRRVALHRANQDLHRLELRQWREAFEQLQSRDAQRPNIRLFREAKKESQTRES